MATRTYSILLSALFLCAAGNATAQMIYKVVNDEGRTTFSDQPALVSEPPVAKTSLPRKRGGKVDTDEAARRLKQARLERELGAEPKPGELKAGTREVNYRYWQRQEKLRINVESALRRSNATLRPQLASR